jgi:hypothetical protein
MYVSCIECTLFLSAWLLQLPGESNARSPGLAALVRVPTARGLFLIPYTTLATPVHESNSNTLDSCQHAFLASSTPVRAPAECLTMDSEREHVRSSSSRASSQSTRTVFIQRVRDVTCLIRVRVRSPRTYRHTGRGRYRIRIPALPVLLGTLLLRPSRAMAHPNLHLCRLERLPDVLASRGEDDYRGAPRTAVIAMHIFLIYS